MPLLRCPGCLDALNFVPFDPLGDQGLMKHNSSECNEQYPVIDGIPRLLLRARRGALVRAHLSWFSNPRAAPLAQLWDATTAQDALVAGFDDEWQRYREVNTRDQNDIYPRYFDLLPPRYLAAGMTVLDCGAGAGRWAFETARRGPRVIAIDLGSSIEIARENTAPDRVAC